MTPGIGSYDAPDASQRCQVEHAREVIPRPQQAMQE